jgi:hypothetical protein
MGAIHANQNLFFVEESHLRLGSPTARKECCEVSLGPTGTNLPLKVLLNGIKHALL